LSARCYGKISAKSNIHEIIKNRYKTGSQFAGTLQSVRKPITAEKRGRVPGDAKRLRSPAPMSIEKHDYCCTVFHFCYQIQSKALQITVTDEKTPGKIEMLICDPGVSAV